MDEDESLATISLVFLGIFGAMCGISLCYKIRRERNDNYFIALDIV